MSLFLSSCMDSGSINYAFTVIDTNALPKNASSFTVVPARFIYLQSVLSLVLPDCSRAAAVWKGD
jgi:hypothetical protein